MKRTGIQKGRERRKKGVSQGWKEKEKGTDWAGENHPPSLRDLGLAQRQEGCSTPLAWQVTCGRWGVGGAALEDGNRSREGPSPPWRYMRMASSRREPRSCARSRGTSSCRSPASQCSPEGRSSSLLLLTRREAADRGSPAQPSATGRKQCTKCSFDFLMVSMRASCQRERDRPQWLLVARLVPRRASPLLVGWQASCRWLRWAKRGQLRPPEA